MHCFRLLLISSINHFINVFCWSLIGFSCICSQPKILNYDIHIKPYFYLKIELYTASFFSLFYTQWRRYCVFLLMNVCCEVFILLDRYERRRCLFCRSLKVLARELRFLFLCLFLYIVKLSWTEHKKEFFAGFKLTSTDNNTIYTMKFVYLFCKDDIFHS